MMEAKWRRPGMLWSGWALLAFGVWLSLLFISLLDRYQFVGAVLGMPAAVVAFGIAYLALILVLSPFLRRFSPPTPVRPPPPSRWPPAARRSWSAATTAA